MGQQTQCKETQQNTRAANLINSAAGKKACDRPCVHASLSGTRSAFPAHRWSLAHHHQDRRVALESEACSPAMSPPDPSPNPSPAPPTNQTAGPNEAARLLARLACLVPDLSLKAQTAEEQLEAVRAELEISRSETQAARFEAVTAQRKIDEAKAETEAARSEIAVLCEDNTGFREQVLSAQKEADEARANAATERAKNAAAAADNEKIARL